MAASVGVLVLLLVTLAATTATAQLLDLYEGDACSQKADGTIWTCQLLDKCPKAKEAVKKTNKRPIICNFSGKTPIVCCEPEVTVVQKKVSKAKEMCKKYGESVILKVPEPFGEGFYEVDTCAAVEPLITGGVNAVPREYPHMALIGYGDKNNIQWLCGGSLISERYVMSAAHCTDPGGRVGPARWVRLGDYNKNSKKDDEMGLSSPENFEIIERINHPNYKDPIVYYDIALYKLNKDVAFSEFIRPICLQTEHQFPKTYAIATGWGRLVYRQGQGSDVLQKVNLTITNRKQCSDAYVVAIGAKLKEGIKDEAQLCAGDIGSGKDTCQGDSGGPLQVRLSDPYCMYSQVGVTSFGSGCGGDRPGVYTRVSYYVPWIESIVWP